MEQIIQSILKNIHLPKKLLWAVDNLIPPPWFLYFPQILIYTQSLHLRPTLQDLDSF